MGDERRNDAADESWTDVEEARPDMVEAVPVRHGMVLGGRYAIDKIIGRGGSGVVVRAHDRDLRQVVAIKIVRAELAGQRVWAERLAREVRLARQIHHPHVCRVFDFQQADARVFLVMELAENGTLRDELRSGALAARPLADRIADARALASALAAIHGAGIVHRDLTPQNMLRMGDGRLVLSDFGLAIDVSESTSVHGGTIAYMAPEVLRGGHSSVASDLWALGAVMHEIVFGAKPLWSDGATPEILTPAPALGRKLTEEERAVLEACRACTAKEPTRRIASAAEAGRMLTERRRWWARRSIGLRRPLIWAGALTLLAAVALGVVRTRSKIPGTQVSPRQQPLLIVPTGEPADWTHTATVLAEVSDRIGCARLLPDKRTIRFVWGSPPRAEDLDTVTRKRIPARLVPAAYAEGCPDLSPDGKRLVYQGHTPDGRAFAFLSQSPDGKDAAPVVPTAEPTMSSEPMWVGDGDAFSYDIDTGHIGVFSTTSRKLLIAPAATSDAYATLFRATAGNAILIAGIFQTGQTEITTVELPWMKEREKFRVAELVLDVRLAGGLYYGSLHAGYLWSRLVELDPQHRSGRRLGEVRGQSIHDFMFLEGGMAFVSTRVDRRLEVRVGEGTFNQAPDSNGVIHANHCGRGIIVDRGLPDGRIVIERRDSAGRLIRELSPGPQSLVPACSPDGQVWFFLDDSRSMVMQCRDSGCRVLVDHAVDGLSVSPDGKRLAFFTLATRGPVVGWMSTDGGEVHEVTDTETGCPVGWASDKTLWVSRRRDNKIVWTEVDADSGKETSRTVPGSRDCADGAPDLASPVNPDLRLSSSRVSQLRLLPREQLIRH